MKLWKSEKCSVNKNPISCVSWFQVLKKDPHTLTVWNVPTSLLYSNPTTAASWYCPDPNHSLNHSGYPSELTVQYLKCTLEIRPLCSHDTSFELWSCSISCLGDHENGIYYFSPTFKQYVNKNKYTHLKLTSLLCFFFLPITKLQIAINRHSPHPYLLLGFSNKWVGALIQIFTCLHSSWKGLHSINKVHMY